MKTLNSLSKPASGMQVHSARRAPLSAKPNRRILVLASADRFVRKDKRPRTSHIESFEGSGKALDIKALHQKSLQLGLPEKAANDFIEYADYLATHELLSVEKRCFQAEKAGRQAEKAGRQAEKRYRLAEKRHGKTLQKLNRLETLVRDRYLQLIELRGSVNLRDELRQILAETSADLVAKRRQDKQGSPSQTDKWAYVFGVGGSNEMSQERRDLLACCRQADGRLNSALKAASAMVRITENLDLRVHRSLPSGVVKRIGGVAIEESALLGASDCKLIACVMGYAKKPCKIVAKEEIDALIEQEKRRLG